MPRILNLKVTQFLYGTIDTIEESTLPRGAASNSKNWITKGDRIILREGSSVFGNYVSGAGKITGLQTFIKQDNTEITFRKSGLKLEYYLASDDTWHETGTNIFPDADEEVSMEYYNSEAGDQMFVNSPSGVFIKIMLANPGSYTDVYVGPETNYKGFIKIKSSRMWTWAVKNDETTVYLSNVDEQNYTTVTAEAIAGSGAGRSGTLAFKAGGAKRTCFAVTFTDGTETFVDNRDGTLTGSAGGTGTINYTSGAYVVTFHASATTVTSTYQWEDSTVGGICDFTYTSPIRVAGEGFFFLQDGGPVRTIESYNNKEYCLHDRKTWVVDITGLDNVTDAGDPINTATNQIYREHVGTPNQKSSVATSDGIYYADALGDIEPQLRILGIPYLGTEVLPASVSRAIKIDKYYQGVDLSGYLFDQACGIEWGDYIIFSCRQKSALVNDTVFIINKKSRAIDRLDYRANYFSINGGDLLAGDSLSGNVYKLFSGGDDESIQIDNYWEGNDDDLGWRGEKKVKKLIVKGTLGTDQYLLVYASYDKTTPVLLGTITATSGAVFSGLAVVGRTEIGLESIGTLGTGDVEFISEIKINTQKFNTVMISFEAGAFGTAEVSSYEFSDYRLKSSKLISKHRA